MRQKAVGVLQRSGMGFSPERSGGSWRSVLRSEQRNDWPEVERMRRQPGFFDVGERLPELSAKGDDLERTSRLVNS